MDIHEIPGGVTAEDVAKAHAEDVKVQSKYGVSYHKYWVNEKEGKIFCLCHAPNAEAAKQVHREAHGLVAEKVIQVEPEVADLFMGGSEVNAAGAVMLPGAEADARDPGIRTILFTDIVDSTSLTRQIGDEAAMELLEVHDSIVRDALAELGGREIKHLGDGIMASFVSAAAALNAPAGFSAKSPAMAVKIKIVHLMFGLASPPANRSSITTICLESPCSWPHVFVRTRRPNRSLFRTSLLSCAKEKRCPSKTSAKLNSKVSGSRFAPMP